MMAKWALKATVDLPVQKEVQVKSVRMGCLV